MVTKIFVIISRSSEVILRSKGQILIVSAIETKLGMWVEVKMAKMFVILSRSFKGHPEVKSSNLYNWSYKNQSWYIG